MEPWHRIWMSKWACDFVIFPMSGTTVLTDAIDAFPSDEHLELHPFFWSNKDVELIADPEYVGKFANPQLGY